MGTPVQAYDQSGNLIWERELDIYGRVRKEKGISNFVPFRYQGQYYDSEVDLCYNRFRYYDCNTGTYISQDPIGLLGNNPNFYAYVFDSNTQVDVFGLEFKTVDFAGHADLFPHQNAIVKIKMQGSRGRDFTEAFKVSGIDKKLAEEYTWHHLADFNSETGEVTMQLVKTKTHIKTFPHRGGVDQFLKHFELVEYSNKGGAVKIAKEKGWIICKK